MLTLQEITELFEDEYGEVVLSEEQCPGVCYLACRADEYEAPIELVVVEKACPYISEAAKRFGAPFKRNDGLLVYDYNAERGGREVVLYEAYRYLVRHGLPLPDENTLLSSAAYYADCYPEYFGPIPAPLQTPQGYMTRYLTLADGIFALETASGARMIALAGVIWSTELQDTTILLGKKVGDPKAPVDVQYLFFTLEDGCLPLFELLFGHPALMESPRLDRAALTNAIWTHHPDYALSHNLREQQGLNDLLGLILNEVGMEIELSGSEKNMVALSPEDGVEYVRW